MTKLICYIEIIALIKSKLRHKIERNSASLIDISSSINVNVVKIKGNFIVTFVFKKDIGVTKLYVMNIGINLWFTYYKLKIKKVRLYILLPVRFANSNH